MTSPLQVWRRRWHAAIKSVDSQPTALELVSRLSTDNKIYRKDRPVIPSVAGRRPRRGRSRWTDRDRRRRRRRRSALHQPIDKLPQLATRSSNGGESCAAAKGASRQNRTEDY